MASPLKQSEAVAAAVKRVVLDELSFASEKLVKHGDDKRDKAIHEARKSIKKIRGVLRAVRPLLGKTYSKENVRFQKLSRELADFRDAAVLPDVFDQLCARNAGGFDADSAKGIRQGLELDRHELENRLEAAKIVRHAAEKLDAAGKRVESWPLELHRIEDLAPGLETTYRRGRRALKAVRKQSTAKAYHNLRKRVKDRWHQTRLLAEIGGTGAPAEDANLKGLGISLGDDHNLTMLRDRFKRNPERYGGASGVEPFLSMVVREQENLRQHSLTAGKTLFVDKPSVYLRRLTASWQDSAPKKPAAKVTSRKTVAKVVG